jgi:UDP-N-acetylglucosamine/UDP-N-acetylgalactosamine 4-epimerase
MDISIDKQSKFLVTGAAGFIGSNIVSALLELGYYVRALDDFSTGKKQNMADFFDENSFEFIEGDISDISVCDKACKDIDYVLHQAALGSVPRSVKEPVVTNRVNIDGTLNMLAAALDNNVKRFIYASSSSVYGDDENLPKKESSVGTPLSPYAVTKAAGEMYAKVFYRLHGLKTIGLRYFNVFGIRQDPDSPYAAVIPSFVKNLLENRPCVIYGDGEQSRDFTHISNVVSANIKACTCGSEAWGRVFNIACGKRTTINELYNNICIILEKNTPPVYKCAREGDVMHSYADISLSESVLGYDPVIDLKRGLELTLPWYKQAVKE